MDPFKQGFYCIPGTDRLLLPSHDKLRDLFLSDEQGIYKIPVRSGIPIFLENTQNGKNDIYRNFCAFRNKWAFLYEEIEDIFYAFNGGEGKCRMQYLEKLNVKPADKVLQVCSGTGASFRYLHPEASFFGVDPSSKMLTRCMKNLNKDHINISLCQASPSSLPFANESFDAVFSNGIINCVPEKNRFIKEMIRVTRPGGRIVISDITQKMIGMLNWLPIFHPIVKNLKEIKPPVGFLNTDCENIEVTNYRNNLFYVLSFRKKYPPTFLNKR